MVLAFWEGGEEGVEGIVAHFGSGNRTQVKSLT